MEKDIEILQRLVDEKELTGIYKTDEIVLQAIENLIARNKELEEGFSNSVKHEVELTRENTKIKYELYHSIPKSKVQEVLDEYGKQIIEDNTVICFYKAIQNLVQEGDK